MVTLLCAYGGIGRHAGFRYQCESVGVRVPLGVPLRSLMRVWYRDCALAFQAKEVSLSLTIRSNTQSGYHLTTKE